MSASTFGYTVYAVLVGFLVLWAAFTWARRPRYTTLDDIVTRLMRHPVWRWAVWAAWAFVGWHLFVRGRGAFE
jgi:hypothetical protein